MPDYGRITRIKYHEKYGYIYYIKGYGSQYFYISGNELLRPYKLIGEDVTDNDIIRASIGNCVKVKHDRSCGSICAVDSIEMDTSRLGCASIEPDYALL